MFFMLMTKMVLVNHDGDDDGRCYDDGEDDGDDDVRCDMNIHHIHHNCFKLIIYARSSNTRLKTTPANPKTLLIVEMKRNETKLKKVNYNLSIHKVSSL